MKAGTATTFQRGRIVLAQWWTRLNDHDVVCPVYDSADVMKKYLHKF